MQSPSRGGFEPTDGRKSARLGLALWTYTCAHDCSVPVIPLPHSGARTVAPGPGGDSVCGRPSFGRLPELCRRFSACPPGTHRRTPSRRHGLLGLNAEVTMRCCVTVIVTALVGPVLPVLTLALAVARVVGPSESPLRRPPASPAGSPGRRPGRSRDRAARPRGRPAQSEVVFRHGAGGWRSIVRASTWIATGGRAPARHAASPTMAKPSRR